MENDIQVGDTVTFSTEDRQGLPKRVGDFFTVVKISEHGLLSVEPLFVRWVLQPEHVKKVKDAKEEKQNDDE